MTDDIVTDPEQVALIKEALDKSGAIRVSSDKGSLSKEAKEYLLKALDRSYE